MTDSTAATGGGFLHPSSGVAGHSFNRWFVPPAALAVHLCIGMAYGFSVFWLPLSRSIGIKKALACPKAGAWDGLVNALTTRTCDWTVADLGWMFTLFFVFLGAASALFGPWVERNGPRRTGLVATLCWCGGMVISAYGVSVHQLWILWLGSGAIGGIGLGLGYISPVSTLIKWFPDRRGMATGMAIMGFGGGAMIGSPLADLLMKHFATPTTNGVAQTLLVMAGIYFVFMTAGSLSYRVPPPGWSPQGWTPPAANPAILARGYLDVGAALATPQFWLLWLVLLMNVSASIGIIGVASPMVQEIFGGRLFHHPEIGFLKFDDADKKAAATVGAAFVGLISLFNIGGRFFWASLSDRIGRRMTYAVFFVLGGLLYGLAAPWAANALVLAAFVAAFCLIVSMYGGGFATVPAYLADLFGTRYVGAIHGVLLTAWSTAGVLGPQMVNYMRQSAIDRGLPRTQFYTQIFWVLTAMLAVGFVANLLIRPVDAARLNYDDEAAVASGADGAAVDQTSHSVGPLLILAWLGVLIPIAWGVWITIAKASALFR
ncbi:MAG TPA: OFA family MFS transporter [Caulobacteraceae bacterium]